MAKAEVADELSAKAAPALFDINFADDHVLSLAERFLLPPFSLLDARSGAWQERKRLWIRMGLRSEDGRDARTFAKAGNADEVSQKILALTNGQSIFDPVLCEMFYRWMVPPGGSILDPFAGGSVRGLVAAVCRRRYYGVDLAQDQVLANYDQALDFEDRNLYAAEYAPTWVTGDSAEVLLRASIGDQQDMPDEYDAILSCPPYHDLEKYSNDPRDLSNMSWDAFTESYRAIIGDAVDMLRADRFAAFVVGEIRGPDGMYRNFVGETIAAFEHAGARYYNEAILVSPAGTLPLRAAKQFVVSRKLGRTHQTALFFVKGDPKKAAEACSDQSAIDAALRTAGRTMDEALEPIGEDDVDG